MTKKEFKGFVKEHKKEIIFSGACICLGVSIGKRKYSVNPVEMELVKGLRGFKNEDIFKDLNEILKEVKGIKVFTGNPIKAIDAAELVKLYYSGNSEAKTTGIVVFQK